MTSAVLDQAGKPVPASTIAAVRARGLMASTAYRAASTTDQDMAGWLPFLGSADADWSHDRNEVVSRITDLLRNDAAASAARDRRTDMVVGSGLRLQARIDRHALGLDREAAQALNKAIESEWRAFANDPFKRCDMERRHSVGMMMRLGSLEQFRTGECLMALRWKPNRGARYATVVQQVDTDRLSNPNMVMDTEELVQGVHRDADGAHIGYWIQNGHPGDVLARPGADRWTWTYEPRFTPHGRPRIIHGFDAHRVSQTRGVPDMAPVVNRFKMLTRYADAEVGSAVVNAMFAAFIKTGHSIEDAAASVMTTADVDDRVNAYDNLRLGGIRVPVLAPGDEIDIPDSSREHGGFTSFMAAFLQSIAATLGLSYEQLSMDFSRTNYSSARAALNEVWRTVQRRRESFIDQVVTWIYLAFLEEAFDRYIDIPDGVPDFWEAPGAWARAEWLGPPRGFIDPVKEAQGSEMRVANMTSTRTREAAEQGLDFEALLDDLAGENQMMTERGITSPDMAAMLSAQGPTDTREEQRP
jgi:lambda family phage portal protein